MCNRSTFFFFVVVVVEQGTNNANAPSSSNDLFLTFNIPLTSKKKEKKKEVTLGVIAELKQREKKAILK